MTNVCLITKLKSTVENSSLIGLGELEFIVVRSSSLNYRNFNSSTIKALDSGYFKATVAGTVVGTNLDEVSIPANSWTVIEFPSNMTFRVRVSNKYSIETWSPQERISMDISQLEYSTMTTSFGCYNGRNTGNISSISGMTNMTRLEAQASDVTGSIDSLSALTSLNTVYLNQTSLTGDVANLNCLNIENLNVRDTAISGSLSSIARLTNLKALVVDNPYITGNISSLGVLIKLTGTLYLGSKCEGTIESMADGMIAAGRTSGTLIVSCYPNKVTYNGNGVSKVTITFSSGSYNVVVNS